MHDSRIKDMNDIRPERSLQDAESVVYWMSRDQRAADNWALIHAMEAAREHGKMLSVVFCLVPDFLSAPWRHYAFMIEGLREVEASLAKLGVPFHILLGDPVERLVEYLKTMKAGLLVSDFSPLRIKRGWDDVLAESVEISFQVVDAHNIVPCWIASDKLEFSARTLRGKIQGKLPIYLREYPSLIDGKSQVNERNLQWAKGMVCSIDADGDLQVNELDGVNWSRVVSSLGIDGDVEPVDWIKPGEQAAAEALNHFISEKLQYYDSRRNDPNEDAQSGLSPYLHYGQISPQRVALEVIRTHPEDENSKAFLEELIVRRELSDNFCYYNESYDRFEGFHVWAQTTLNAHRLDPREYLYELEDFETGQTHDTLWNAAQHGLVVSGKMHGYMRMYWAKKILEWTSSPEKAMRICIYLNDRYALDGRDPNGYAGIAWSVGGVHDRAWKERPVYGKIRYMNRNGCKRKFSVEAYIDFLMNQGGYSGAVQ